VEVGPSPIRAARLACSSACAHQPDQGLKLDNSIVSTPRRGDGQTLLGGPAQARSWAGCDSRVAVRLDHRAYLGNQAAERRPGSVNDADLPEGMLVGLPVCSTRSLC
jgi:hypothetical protein